MRKKPRCLMLRVIRLLLFLFTFFLFDDGFDFRPFREIVTEPQR